MRCSINTQQGEFPGNGGTKACPISHLTLCVGFQKLTEVVSGTETTFRLSGFGFLWKFCFPNARHETLSSGQHLGEMHENNETSFRQQS